MIKCQAWLVITELYSDKDRERILQEATRSDNYSDIKNSTV
jgi:hypothetical protein